jgi:Mg-chelatase subunit ChlI
LIDILPDNILRWAGAGVQSIGSTVDTSDDLIAEWEWQLPYRVQSVAFEATSLIKEGLYDPGQKVYEAAKTEAAKTAVKEEKEAAQAKQQMERERAEAAQAVNTPQAQKEAREAREAQEKYLRERQEADAAKERAEKGFGIKKEAIQSAATPKDTKSGGGLGGLLKGFFSGGNK